MSKKIAKSDARRNILMRDDKEETAFLDRADEALEKFDVVQAIELSEALVRLQKLRLEAEMNG